MIVGRHLRGLWEKAGMALVLLALLVCFSLFVPYFFNWPNVTNLAYAVATVGLISTTMLFCLASGDFDLSVGSVVAMSGVISAVVSNSAGVGMGIAAGVLAGGAVGLFNGVIIAQLGINALITTLASMEIVRGLAYIISHDNSIGLVYPDVFSLLGSSHPLGVPTPAWIMIAAFVVFGVLLNRTTFGRNTLAIGGNPEAARLAGVRVVWTKIVIFTLQGLIAGLAGVIQTGKFTSGQPNSGQGLELDVISACVLGGVSLTGGIGTMLGVVVGVFIMGSVDNAMELMHIDSNYQYVVRGGILITAVLIDRLKQWFSRG